MKPALHFSVDKRWAHVFSLWKTLVFFSFDRTLTFLGLMKCHHSMWWGSYWTPDLWGRNALKNALTRSVWMAWPAFPFTAPHTVRWFCSCAVKYSLVAQTQILGRSELIEKQMEGSGVPRGNRRGTAGWPRSHATAATPRSQPRWVLCTPCSPKIVFHLRTFSEFPLCSCTFKK